MKRPQLKPTVSLFSIILSVALCVASAAPTLASQLEENEPIDMSLKDAKLVQVLRSFASIMGGEAVIDPAVAGKVTIEVEDSPWQDALNQICLQQLVNCEILSGEKPVLRVRPLDAVQGIRLQPGFLEAIDLTLKKAQLKQTLESFGVISGRNVELVEGVQGAVTLNLYGAPWSVVLEEVCDLEGCEVEWGKDGIQVGPRQTPSPRRTDLELDDVSLEDALEIVAGLPLFGPLGAPEVVFSETLVGSVAVDLENAHWVDILNTILGPLNLEWKFRYGAPSRLEVAPKASKKKTEEQATLRPRPSSASEGFELGLGFFPAAAAAEEGNALFNWQKPLHGLTASNGWRFQTSWIPFGPELQILVPMLVRCEGAAEGSSNVHLFEPVQLPLETTWSSRFGGMEVEMGPAAESGRQDETKTAKGRECSTEFKSASEVVVTRMQGSTTSKTSGSLAFPGEVGAYLLITLPDQKQVAAAVVALGNVGEALRLALVIPNGGGGVEVMDRHFAPGEAIAELGPEEGKRYELRLKL